ncbi:MAG: hypothetical protein UW27_C0007G0016 [Parcubacteria group bacterium GW2011_GWA1_44_13]|uniref:Uncharacterized protein n=1 Tax=Candidatus Nomurabacteria bacterium GW2011_GWB1_44_12 TaxID=1618748 RepID=A0A837I801_9BACT|nr:MAG: hypothetical protein UW17_C0034G0007 [Candidatus Nomurabacteria bacterium GW2011_GWD1_44_10]KKT36939.1 MAG: hypothetical protein UW25_C0004G0267 [Candidatus Nomurabacteria bacterium GW2011_GWB1_44_12]KKT37961.1 MAG: hypothetical protein UW27_C0007G0016 [Parcubacteria group bacterium GW2011_GWA1_44_13]KKT60825.1 MAG: hypothetical protein UW54_C0003G0003 [Parcubacteria group bacterium GW2011_GWC1_44_26]HBB44115.1 hypothetical protein [Candidatus Yonathbacteria bacterium]
MKYFLPILVSLIITLGLGAVVTHAQNYVPLAPLPIGTGGTVPSTYNLSSYLSGMIKLLIALGGALAVLFAIIGGVQYVVAGISPDAKSGAKERVTMALIGLAIILTSYLLLNSINPKLVQFNLALEPVTPKALETFKAVGTWGDDTAIRNVLLSQDIKINKQNCSMVGQQGCTSVLGLSGQAQVGLQTLAQNCSKSETGFFGNKCDVTITGGTEYWLHKSHTNGRTVDLSQGGAGGILNSYIKRGGAVPITNCGVKSDPHYQPDGASGGIYVDEPNRDSDGNVTSGRHWHVCY